jgi:uncharacterized repeat protein (TIGR01451 family)
MRVRTSRVHGIVAALLATLGFAAPPATAQITETVLTGAGTDARPAWSPDGTTILFDSFRSGNPDIWSIPVAGGSLTRLTFSKNLDQAPCWSPDGTQYAFAAVQGSGAPNIWTRPSAGGPAVLLHDDPANTDGLPDWSPDGTKVAYVKGSDVFVVDAAGGTPVQITSGGGNNTHPSWSPDGTMIAYQSSVGGNIDVYVVPAAGGTATRLTFDPAPEGAPDWSPDGSTIAYQSSAAGNNDIWTMPASGGPGTQITTDPGNDQHPDWSPDGNRIVFARNGGLTIATLGPVTASGADLGLTKVVNNPTPPLGGSVTYTLSLTNFGPNPATGVAVTDLLPAGVAYASSLPSQGSYASGTGIWAVGSLGVNATAVLDITVDIVAGGNVTVLNSAAVTASDSTDTNAANDFGNATLVPVVPADNALRLTNDPGNDTMPAWSPDGTRIAWASNRTGLFKIYLMDPDGTNVTQLTFGPGDDGHPEFSHDGTMIAFDSDRDGDSDIYTVPVTGGTPFQVQNQIANEKRPTWSPDDTEIAFDSDAATKDIWRVPATGGSLIQVTTDPGLDNDAEYSADGQTILFDSDRSGSIHVYTIPVNGGATTQLTTVNGPNFDPEWSPDFTQIAFNSGRGVSQDVWIMPAGGEPPAVQVTNGPGVDAILAWSPDGTRIAFVSDRLGQKEIYVVDLNVPPPPPSSDLAVAAVVDDPAPFENDAVTYTVTVTNNGTLDNSGIEVTDVLPAGVTFVSALPSQGSYSSGTGVWTVGSLTAGSAAALDLTVTVDPGTAGQTITNTASVTAALETDSIAFNNTASVDITVGTVSSSVVFTQLASGGVSDQRPAWSPDGQTIVFDSNRAGNRDLWLVSSAGGAPTQITFNKKFDGQPEYHPDGSRVVFSAVANAGSDLYTKSVPTGPTLALLIDPVSADRYPEYSSDASLVVIDKASDIYLMPAGGGTPAVLVTNPASEGHPAFSPDGQWVAYNSDRNGSVDIWVVPAAGGAEIQMTTSPALDGTADWSPDGEWIAFHSDRDGQAAIWVMPFNGGAGGPAVKLSDGSAPDTQPTWSPDGTEIAFSRAGDIWKMSGYGSLLATARALPGERPADIVTARAAGAAPSIDLELRAAVDRIDPAEGDPVVFEVTVLNVSGTDATGVAIEQILPAGLTLLSAAASDGAYDPAAGTWVVPALAAGASAVLEIRASVDYGTAGQTIASSSTLSVADQADADGTNDSDWVRMVVGAGSGGSTPAVSVSGLPTEFSLAPGRPNPFRSSTTFRFDLPRAGHAELVIFDVTGRRVKTLVSGDVAAGRFDAVWDGRDETGARTSPGVYFVRLQTQGYGETRKAVRID